MQLYNSLNRRKEPFEPREPGKVSMYVCGITAYDVCHIGHARSAAVFDVLVRYLRHAGYEVTFIRNFTDVDDKIIKRANEEGQSSQEVAEKNIQYFYEDMDKLNVLRADIEPKCTEHIQEMIDLTSTLLDKGFAYSPLTGGDVYFRVRAFDDYGLLSGRDLDDLRGGARIQPGEGKEDPLDFALWKQAKEGEPSWDSPWGQGRPGWHLECSAMSEKYVSLPLDIHGGGLDLIFPHHENEIAQTRCARDVRLANYWVHNGFVQVEHEKMSKSLGNFFTMRDIYAKFLPEVLRFFLLSVHYRSPLDFTFEAMEESEKGLARIYKGMAQMREQLQARSKWSNTEAPSRMLEELRDHEHKFAAAMEDDLNTAGALGHVFSVIRLAGRLIEDKALRKSKGAKEMWERILDDLAKWGEVLGLFQQEPASFLNDLRDKRAQRAGIDADKVNELLVKRAEARKNKDFEASDALRDELAALGVAVKDTPRGQEWDVL
ncbi:cysteine--tRNA ligase [Desulfohalovibrio reitneri]|uniref:cysteine--tRNA ligase n=1 Tax=Desulfohalovibrio reitneri TaxID=1307759 RepID=UPI0004A76C25|nr:cysteine--tRNA ligase [Desulfohalovibrio reitneri]